MSCTPSQSLWIANIFVKLVSSKSPTCAVMDYGLIVLCAFLALAKSEEVPTSGKLDFGPDAEIKNDRTVTLHLPSVSTQTNNGGFPSNITSSVTCGSNGCNTTNSNNSIETQILVHVRTKVNLDKILDQKTVENSSGVPVLAGYEGSRPEDVQIRENSLPVPTSDPKGNFYYKPSYNERNYPLSPELPQYGPSSFSSDGRDYSFRSHYPSEPPPYVSSQRPPIDRFYGPSTPYEPIRPFNYNLNSVVSVTPPSLSRRAYENGPRSNGVEQRMPYFEHTYNKHHFSEEAPPHTIWLGNENTRNPVEFRNIPRDQLLFNGFGSRKFGGEGSNFSPSPLELRFYEPPYRRRNHGTECSCREQRSTASNLYAAASNNYPKFFYKKPETSLIDDKLAPLK
ncbi:uncharacterized protein [Euwallacea similis]|uniref:uncharacterized protein n=1 Tax=Euwallacea similis TaxID=1736056 RepID=UPI00344FB06F